MASKGYSNLERYIEKSKIPEIMKMYRFEGPTRDEIFELIRWKCVSASMGNARKLFEQLQQIEFESKVEAPHFMQLNYLLSSYIQSIYVYYVNYEGFSLNTSGLFFILYVACNCINFFRLWSNARPLVTLRPFYIASVRKEKFQRKRNAAE